MMTKLITIFSFFSLQFSSTAVAQAFPLSVKTTLDSLQNQLQVAQKDSNKVNLLNAVAAILESNENFSGCKEYANQALTLAKEIRFIPGEADAFRNLGDGEWSLGNAPEAMSYYFSSLKLEEKLQRKDNIAYLWYAIGAKYVDMENYPEAVKCFQSSREISEALGDSINVGKTSSALGDTYISLGDYPNALLEYEKALSIYKDGGGKPHWLGGMAYYGIGDVKKGLLTQNKTIVDAVSYQPVIDSYLAAAAEFELETKFTGGASKYCKNAIALIYVQINKLAEAKSIFTKNLEWAKTSGDKNLISQSLFGLFSIDSVQKNYEQAYFHYKEYRLYQDSVLNIQGNKKMHLEKLQYEFNKKEIEAKRAQDKKDAETKRIKNLQYTVIAAVLLIAIFLFFNSLQNNKAKKKIERAYKDLKSAQSQLIQSEKMASLGELTAGIAHEIQNPLNFINNFSEVSKELIDELQGEKQKPESERDESLEDEILNDIRKNLEKINHHGKRADGIVKGMLQHSRNSAGQKELTDINALCDEYLRLAYHGLRAKDKTFNAEMKTDFDDTIGKINIVPQDMGRVILNLVTNAFYAVNEKSRTIAGSLEAIAFEPTVKISTKKEKDKIEIKVKDNGNGIPEKILGKIFQPFFTTKPTGQGTGLGLSLAYDIVRTHGGELKVETKENTGLPAEATAQAGTTFIISIPTNS